MYEDHSLLIDTPDYLKIAGSNLTLNERRIYHYLFTNKCFIGSGVINAKIAKATNIKPNNSLVSLHGLISKGLVYSNEKKEYWVKRYDTVNKAMALKVIDKETKQFLDNEERKRRKYYFELGYVQEEMFEQFVFISDENLEIFINREKSIIKRHKKILRKLKEEKRRRESDRN